jgi:hypothetical protein
MYRALDLLFAAYKYFIFYYGTNYFRMLCEVLHLYLSISVMICF